MKTFEELGVALPIRQAIEELGFVSPMPVQEQVIPFLLNARHDLIALAQTGTGKTAAFGIPLLQRLDPGQRHPQALVLSPTRELCLQITDDLRDFAKHLDGVRIVAVYGGTSIVEQMRAVKKGVQVVVATPGRLIDLLKRGALTLDEVNTVVLDEADEMLNMGFKEDIDEILSRVPKWKNNENAAETTTEAAETITEAAETTTDSAESGTDSTESGTETAAPEAGEKGCTILLFSATMSRDIERIARTYLHEPEEIVVGSRNEGAENVNHIFYMVQAKDRYLALKRVVDYHPRIYAIIFCRTKRETQEIADKLIQDGYNAEALHGDLSQQQRDLTMQKFRQHLTQLLVATDVAARGLDVDDLTHVINFSMPDDIENYTHRSGRTGRAGKRGTSIAIVHQRENRKIRDVEREIGKKFERGKLPTPQEICTKQLYRVMDLIGKADVDEEQIAPFMDDINRHFEFFDKETLIKKIVSREFGKFLAYYADAPEVQTIEKDEKGRTKDERGKRRGERRDERGPRKPERGFARLFVNLGKDDGFFPGEVMQFINRNVPGEKVTVGHIDLLPHISYIEVPTRDARRVMEGLSGTVFKGRPVRCNDAEKGGKGDGHPNRPADKAPRGDRKKRSQQASPAKEERHYGKQEWMKFFVNEDGSPRGPRKKARDADFAEDEGWARRRPKKK